MSSVYLDTAIATVLVILLFSVLAYAVNEWWSAVRQLRGKMLEYAVFEALNDKLNKSFGVLLYEHPQIDLLKRTQNDLPSYMPATNFATALIDLISRESTIVSYVTDPGTKLLVTTVSKFSADPFACFQAGVAKLNPSAGRLKEIQQNIRHRILLKILLPPNIKGAVKGSNNIANGRAHLGKKFKFKTDMKKYYPSITPDVVYQLFRDHGFSNKCCSILTHLTTYKHELPQGTPTGPDIANRIFLPQDKKIIRYCLKYGITYTRYIDDLVFSCRKDFRAHCLPLIDFILEAGFKISIEKTLYRAGKMEITGVTVKNNVLDVSDYFKTLMSDETIPKQITQGRKAYYKQVRKKLVKR